MPNVSDKSIYDTLIKDDSYWWNNPGKRKNVQWEATTALRHWICRHVLDAGCGRGDLAAHLAYNHFRVTGCDVVDCRFYIQRKNTANGKYPIKFEQCDLTEMPFSDDQFDAVVCVDVIEHLYPDDVDAALSEMLRVAPRLYIRAACYPSHHGEFRDLHRTLELPEQWNERLLELANIEEMRIEYKNDRTDRPIFVARAERR